MFDKMVFSKKIDFKKDAEVIAIRNHLQKCSEGLEIFYQSSCYGNFDGVYIKIRGSTMTVKCSLHKIFYKTEYGSLDNSKMFTMSDALGMIDMLFEIIGVDQKNVKVTYFEIGLNIPVVYDPLQYIEQITSVGKEMFNDANFQKNRQKTTEKSKNIRKVMKIYDKGFEARSKGKMISGNILRLETIYKRQSVPLSQLMSEEFLGKISSKFINDWSTAEFPRSVVATKGIKASELEKARAILLMGKDGYFQKCRKEFFTDALTKKQWETIRIFIKKWDEIKSRFQIQAGKEEQEYQNKLSELFVEAYL